MNRSWMLCMAWLVVTSSMAVAQSVDLWVLDGDTDSVLGLDASGAIVSTVALPGDGAGTAVTHDGAAWISIPAEQLIVKVDVDGIAVSVSPPEPVLALAVAADGSFWGVSNVSSEAFHFDDSGVWLETATVGSVPFALAIDGVGRVWVTNAFGNSVTRIDIDGSTAEFPVGFYPTGIAAHPGGNVWVIEKTGITILAGDGSVVSTQAVGSFPRGVTVALDGDVWVSDQGAHSVLQFDSAGQLLDEHTVGYVPWGISASGDGSVSVLCGYSGEVFRLDDDGAVLAVTAVGYPNAIGDLSGLQLAMTVLPEEDFDGDSAANMIESVNGTDPLDAGSQPVSFVRGDASRDGVVDIVDVFVILGHGDAPVCQEALDVDDSGMIDLADAANLLSYLFMGGASPAAPFPAASYDSSPASGYPCEG